MSLLTALSKADVIMKGCPAKTSRVVESRRAFLKTTALAGAVFVGGRAVGQVRSVAEDKSAPADGKLQIKIAGYTYDRVEALMDGRVQIEGCDAQFKVSSIEICRHQSLFSRFRGQETGAFVIVSNMSNLDAGPRGDPFV